MTAATNTLSAADRERKQARRENWHLLRRRPSFIIGSVISAFWVFCAILGDKITPFDPLNYTTKPKLSPSGDHWFGTDKIGRDIFSRVIAGGRDVLLVAPPAAVLGVALGTILGMIMGYYRGWVDLLLSRIVEALLALPVVLIGLLMLTLADTSPLLGSITFHSRKLLVIYVVALLFTPIVARTVRSAVIGERELDYVTSARLRGESGGFIMSREILPNIMGPIIVELTVRIGYAVFTVATLSFLGAGPPPPSPDWGSQVSDNYNSIVSGYWWSTFFPAMAIASLVVATNLIADSVQSVMEGS